MPASHSGNTTLQQQKTFKNSRENFLAVHDFISVLFQTVRALYLTTQNEITKKPRKPGLSVGLYIAALTDFHSQEPK